MCNINSLPLNIKTHEAVTTAIRSSARNSQVPVSNCNSRMVSHYLDSFPSTELRRSFSFIGSFVASKSGNKTSPEKGKAVDSFKKGTFT